MFSLRLAVVVEKRRKTSFGASRVLDADESTTRCYADISLELRQAGRPIPTNDIWIAALCRQHELPLLSRDRHFDTLSGIQRLEW